jgi:hypothetical protein
MAGLSDDDQNAIFKGHEELMRLTKESGEFVATKALAEPDTTAVVRVRDGAASTSAGAYQPAAEFMCGYYVVDTASRDRAVELAAMIPDARYAAVEVREIVFEDGGDAASERSTAQ